MAKTRKKKVAKKKKVTKKKKAAPKKPVGLAALPPEIQEKARKSIEAQKKYGPWNIRSVADDKLPPVPKKKAEKTVKGTKTLRSVGSMYSDESGGSSFETFLKQVSKVAETLQKNGATKVFVNHQGVRISGIREETDEEFKKRVAEIEYKRALIFAARGMMITLENEEGERREKRRLKRDRDRFETALENLPEEEIEKLLTKYRKKKAKASSRSKAK